MRQSAYPTTDASAAAFFVEAVRHLNDAYVLFSNDRFAAAVASAHKAQELAVKAALIQENAMGNYEKLFGTHKPLSDITGNRVLNMVNTQLDTWRSGLALNARNFELLEPTKNGLNAEYPFYPVAADLPLTWISPAVYFTRATAAEYYSIACEVLLALSQIYSPDLRPEAEPLADVISDGV